MRESVFLKARGPRVFTTNCYLLFVCVMTVVGGLEVVTAAEQLNSTITVAARLPCDCWTGTRTADLTTCSCSCPTGYEQPHCAWTAAELTTIDIVTTFENTSEFSGSSMGRRLRLKLGLDPAGSDLYFTIVEPPLSNPLTRAYSSFVVGRFTVIGNVSTTLFAAIHADTGRLWTTEIGVNTIYPYFPDIAPAVNIQGDKWFSLSTGVDVHTNDIIWVVFLLILCSIACMECCCCSGNTTTKAQAAHDEQFAAVRIAALAGFGGATQSGAEVGQVVNGVVSAWGPNAPGGVAEGGGGAAYAVVYASEEEGGSGKSPALGPDGTATGRGGGGGGGVSPPPAPEDYTNSPATNQAMPPMDLGVDQEFNAKDNSNAPPETITDQDGADRGTFDSPRKNQPQPSDPCSVPE